MEKINFSMLKLYILVNFFMPVFSQISIEVTYEEIESLGAPFRSSYSCEVPEGDISPRRKCVCDPHCRPDPKKERRLCDCEPHCVEYGTCCFDSPYRLAAGPSYGNRTRREECTEVHRSDYMYYMVKRCHPFWRGNRTVINMCHRDFQDLRDPFNAIPVTNFKTQTTYKNIYCGICNGISPVDLTFWNVSVIVAKGGEEEPMDQNEISERLVYDEISRKWLHREFVEKKGRYLYTCLVMNYLAPENSRRCIPNLISDCHPSWVEDEIKAKCQAYLAPIYYFQKMDSTRVRSLSFRNIHCAICNGANLQTGSFTYKHPTEFDPELNSRFDVPFDFKPNDGTNDRPKCNVGEVYDPFLKKCRTLGCALPGYVLRNNQCVRS